MSLENTTKTEPLNKSNESVETKPVKIEAGTENNQKQNPENEPINFETQSADIDSHMEKNKENLQKKTEDYETWKKKLDETYSSLGQAPKDQKYPEQKQLDKLKEEDERLKEQKQRLETGKEMQAVLSILNKLPPSELKIIIETGKNSNGEEVQGGDGKKLKPEAAKSLAKLALEGIKSLTKFLLSLIFGNIGGTSSGIYESVKK